MKPPSAAASVTSSVTACSGVRCGVAAFGGSQPIGSSPPNVYVTRTFLRIDSCCQANAQRSAARLANNSERSELHYQSCQLQRTLGGVADALEARDQVRDESGTPRAQPMLAFRP